MFAFVASDDAAWRWGGGSRWSCEYVGLCAILPPRPRCASTAGLVPGGMCLQTLGTVLERHDEARSLAATGGSHCHAGWKRRGPLCPGPQSGPVSITSYKLPFPDSREICDDETVRHCRTGWAVALSATHVSRCRRLPLTETPRGMSAGAPGRESPRGQAMPCPPHPARPQVISVFRFCPCLL